MHCMAKPWGWDIQGIPSLPSCLPWCWWCLLGDCKQVAGDCKHVAGDCKHVAGDWRWHWGWCEDVAAQRGWSTMQTLLGFGSWGQPGLIRPACHIMVRFILSDALQWSLLVEEGDLPLHPCISGCPGLGGRVHREWHPLKERWMICPGRVRGQRCPGEPEWPSQVPGVQLCALYQATRTFGEVLGQESYSTDCLEVVWMFFSSQISLRNML